MSGKKSYPWNAAIVVLVLAGPLGWVFAQETPYEISEGKKTPSYEETMQWCQDLADGSSLLQFQSFGISGEGRPLMVMVADLKGKFDPAEHDQRGDRVVALVEACIHAGESCGKDAGMLLLRDLANDAQLAEKQLQNTTLLFVPIFNADGHERSSPYGRINQNGPEEMGWRVTANNQNLNRDFLKSDTPEMRALLGLWGAWDPDFFVDIHSTDGADYQYPLTYGLEVRGNMEAGLTAWTKDYRDAMHVSMEADGYPISPYVSFKNWHDPRSGMTAGVMGPRFSQGYAAIRNRPGLLIETHMLKDYPTRVESTRLMLSHSLNWLTEHGADLRQRIAQADAFTSSKKFRDQRFPLTFSRTEDSVPFEFLGVHYEKVKSEVTGGDWFRYFSDQPETMELDFFETMEPDLVADLPEAYIVPRQWSVIIDRLKIHGVQLRELTRATELKIRTSKFSDVKWRERPYEGHHPLSFSVEPLTEVRSFPAGSVVVDMNQPLARVAAHILEPQGPDSMLRWGYLDAIFERVEYVESYVIENMIAEMVKENPELLVELEARKSEDPEFAGNPWAIRYWFYEKTPYFDQRVGVYPVGSLDDRKTVEDLPLKQYVW